MNSREPGWEQAPRFAAGLPWGWLEGSEEVYGLEASPESIERMGRV